MEHGTPTYHIHASSHLPPIEEDYALAIRLQEDELEQYSARHPQASAQDPDCPEDQQQPRLGCDFLAYRSVIHRNNFAHSS